MNTLDKIAAILQSKAFCHNNDVLQVDTSTHQAFEFVTSLLKRAAPVSPTALTDHHLPPTKRSGPLSSPVRQVPRVGAPSVAFPSSPPSPSIPPELLRVPARLSAPPAVHLSPDRPCPTVNAITCRLSSPYHHRLNLTQRLLQRLPHASLSFLHKSVCHIHHEQTGKKQTLRALLKDPSTTSVWSHSASNEFGRLMNGNHHGVVGTQAMEMVQPSAIPQAHGACMG